MYEGDVLSRQDRIEQARQTLEELGAIPRGDSFDVADGEFSEVSSSRDLVSLLSNPQGLIGSLNLTPAQAKNVKSIIVGGGTGAVHRMLSQYLGDELAAAVGGLISGYLAKRLVGR